MSNPLSGPSSGHATYNLFHFPSSASDTYALTAAMNKGKATTIVLSPSHTVTGISAPHISTSTYGNGVATPLPLFLPPFSTPCFVPPNTPCMFHTPPSFPSYYPLSPSVSVHSPQLSQSPFALRAPSYASPLSMHTSIHSIAHSTLLYTPPVTPRPTPVPVPHTPHFLPAHSTPLHTPFMLLPPLPAPPFLLGAVAPVQSIYTHLFKSDLPDLTKIPMLSSDADWMAWNQAVLDLLDNLCLFRHIASPSPTSVPASSLAQPSFPLALNNDPSADQLGQHDAWWWADGTVWHILQGRLGPAPEALVPLYCDAFGNIVVSS